MRVAYLGNWRPPYSTENDYARAWRAHGHTVEQFQEGETASVLSLTHAAHDGEFDLIVWTRTPSLSKLTGAKNELRLLNDATCPVIGVHLDRWWGLERQRDIFTEPYFRVDLLLTADGDHDTEWEQAKVRHRWLAPGVSHRWCGPGVPDEAWACDVAFVGTTRGYHREWGHRTRLIARLEERFKDRVRFWPRRGEPGIRGFDLNDLYWSAKVVVGDSCLVPNGRNEPVRKYCSDRIPESLGRGAILVHPYVAGITDQLFEHRHWELGDWRGMDRSIEAALELRDGDRVDERHYRIEQIKARHTYEHRVGEITAILAEEGIL